MNVYVKVDAFYGTTVVSDPADSDDVEQTASGDFVKRELTTPPGGWTVAICHIDDPQIAEICEHVAAFPLQASIGDENPDETALILFTRAMRAEAPRTSWMDVFVEGDERLTEFFQSRLNLPRADTTKKAGKK